MLEAVIFDLDGVICHTDLYHYQAWKAVTDRLGIPFDERINARLRGVSRMDSLDIILEQADRSFTPHEKELLAEEKNQIYQSLLRQMTPAELGTETVNVLNTLRGMGLKMAIASSSRNTALILKRLGLDTFFDAVADGNQISRSKPDPEVFLLAASLLGVQPSNALVVEDAAAGVCAAKVGGFKAAGLGDAARESGVDFGITTLEELITIGSNR